MDGIESRGNTVAQPVFESSFETGKPYKVHKSYIWLGPVVATAAFLLIVALNSIQVIVQFATALQDGDLPFSPLVAILVVLGGVVLIFALMVALYVLSYKNMWYVFDEREFSYYAGIITKRRVHIPYARVQSVNHRASIVQRIAGVCTVSIDTAGGAQNKAVRVPYLQLNVAEALRVELFMRKAATMAGAERAIVYVPANDPTTPEGAARQAQGGVAPMPPQQLAAFGAAQGAPVAPNGFSQAPASGAPVPPGAMSAQPAGNFLDDTVGEVADWRGAFGGAIAGLEPVSYECKLENKELLLTSFSHSSPLVVALIVGISMVVTFGGIMLSDDAPRFLAMAFLPLVFGITLGSYIIGVLSIAISYGGFSARRRGSRIEVERGLLQRVFSGIDIERVQTIEIRQSFIRRLMGYCEISLGRIGAATDGGSSGNNNSNLDARGLVIHPFVKIDRVDEILAGLAPELEGRPRVTDLHGLAPVAVRRSVIRHCVLYNWAFWAALFVTGMWLTIKQLVFAGRSARIEFEGPLDTMFIIWLVVCVLVTIYYAIHAVTWAKHSGYALNAGYVALHNDGLSTQHVVIPRRKVQSIATRSNPFQRRLGLTSIVAITAAGTSSTAVRLLDVSQQEGDAALDWVKPRTQGNASSPRRITFML